MSKAEGTRLRIRQVKDKEGAGLEAGVIKAEQKLESPESRGFNFDVHSTHKHLLCASPL